MSKPDDRVVAWLHTMHMEGNQHTSRLSMAKADPFGRRGIDYDPSYKVTSEPLALRASFLAMKAERDTLQSRLDGVLRLADRLESEAERHSKNAINKEWAGWVRDDHRSRASELNGAAKAIRSAALGGESTGNEEGE